MKNTQYVEHIRKSCYKMSNVLINLLENNLLLENYDISGDFVNSLVELYKVLSTKDDDEFLLNVKRYIINDKGVRYLVLLLISHPKESDLYSLNYIKTYGQDFEIRFPLDVPFYDFINSNYDFLFYLLKGNKPDTELLEYWLDNPIIKDKVYVSYRLHDQLGKVVSLQIMTFENFTYDVKNIIKKPDIRNFIGDILNENRILKDKINVSFRKQLGNGFSLL